ncbi:MAG: YigZ family protein [Cyclobacteriaceae bacterium]|nr:YigZ family protein [Cyclobacteriaceae bacterium]
MYSYKTIAKEGKGEFKDRGSKFIGLAFPVETREEADARLQQVKTEYYDARHHCYAFIMGKAGETQFANDDGEPSHSAGDPILGQIRSLDITNTLVVVVRYFGGTKLGVPGLINAYKTAAVLSLENTRVKIIELRFQLMVLFPYESTSSIEKLINLHNLEYIEKKYGQYCQLTLSAPEKDRGELIQLLDILFSRKELIKYNIL